MRLLKRIEGMGEIRATLRLENIWDHRLHAQGKLPKKKVRAALVDAVVDTGAVMMLLPKDLVAKLGLMRMGTLVVRLADERTVELQKAGGMLLTLGGRVMEASCLVGPAGCEPLIGQLVMEELDLIADPARRALCPRLPEGPVLKMKQSRDAAIS